MNISRKLSLLLALTVASHAPSALAQPAATPPAIDTTTPTDWIDPDTGHRIIRLSLEPGSRTLYFHDNSYSPQGDKLTFMSPSGIALLDITKLGTTPPKPEIVVPNGTGNYMARRTREVYFTLAAPGGGGGGGGRGRRGGQAPADGQPAAARGDQPAPAEGGASAARTGAFGGGEVFAYNFDTKQTRKVPNASRTLISADETFTMSKITAEDPTGKIKPPPHREPVPQLQRMFPGKKMEELSKDQQYAVNKEEGLARRTINPAGEAIIFTNLKTGKSETVGYQYGSINHMQFSPTDPNLLLFCHEGTWHEVDRVWTIRTDGSDMQLRHKRTMDMEIAGHEFWSFDGKTIWFDLQMPRSVDFWIGGVNIDTGKETRYHLRPEWWGVHFNVSRDNKLFMSDGGDPTQVAFQKDGMWINLLRVQPNDTVTREKLVNMSKHNYVTGQGGIEPNGSITPDNKWVIFSGNMFGVRHVYAVEIAAAK